MQNKSFWIELDGEKVGLVGVHPVGEHLAGDLVDMIQSNPDSLQLIER